MLITFLVRISLISFFVVTLFNKALAGSDLCLRFEQHYCTVSLMNIITTPERFVGKKVSIHGVFKKNFGKYLIYYSKEKEIIGSTVDAIEVDITEEVAEKIMLYEGEYVGFKGVLDMNDNSTLKAVLHKVTLWNRMELGVDESLINRERP